MSSKSGIGKTLASQVVIEQYESGLSCKQIAKIQGVSADTIHVWLRKWGVRPRRSKWTPNEIARLRELYASPPSEFLLAAFAKELGRSRMAVALKANEIGLSSTARPKRPLCADERARIGRRMREQIAERGHPRGMRGKSHTEEVRRAIGERTRQLWVEAKASGTIWMSEANRQKRSDVGVMNSIKYRTSNPYSRTKSGKRDDLGDTFFRSSWEANYARYLNFLVRANEIAGWEYEPETFWFLAIKRGARSYTPDFRIYPKKGEPYFVEVKGWMDPKSKTKLKRMAKYYPSVKIEVVDAAAYKALKSQVSKWIKNWE